MLEINVKDEFTQNIAREVVQQLVPILLEEFRNNELPHLLTRKEFMALANIGESKCNELFHRKDFPVNRELGHPRVPTKAFFEWINKTNQNANLVNLPQAHRVV